MNLRGAPWYVLVLVYILGWAAMMLILVAVATPFWLFFATNGC